MCVLGDASLYFVGQLAVASMMLEPNRALGLVAAGMRGDIGVFIDFSVARRVLPEYCQTLC